MVKKGILKEILFYEKNHNSFFIIDKKVFELYFKDKIKIKNLFLVDAVEDSKSLIGVIQFMEYLLKNGVNILVPPFVESGDVIIVDTRSIEYVKKV